MLDFDKYVGRYGEFGVQAIIERIERNDGIKAKCGTTLEERWIALMQADQPQQRMAA
jgi:hypothetical protein